MSKIDLAQYTKLYGLTAISDNEKKKVVYRRLFCQIFNLYLPSNTTISLTDQELLQTDLLTIFYEKIFSFFPLYRLRPEVRQKVVKIYAHESLLFQQFFKQSLHPKARYLTQTTLFNPDFKVLIGYQHPAAKLISLLFDGKEVQLMPVEHHIKNTSQVKGIYRCQK